MSNSQAQPLTDGDWETPRASTLDALNSKGAAPAAEGGSSRDGRPSQVGLLSRTLVPTPVSHWVLPARIRSKAFIDVAFVGGYFVQISEVGSDGQIVNIIRKDDFRCRIRNAVILGESPAISTADFPFHEEPEIKLENTALFHPFVSDDGIQGQPLPPQILVLAMEDSTFVFLFVTKDTRCGWKFEMSEYTPSSKAQYHGFHLTIDPSSRYLVAASTEKVVFVYQLADRATLEAQWAQHSRVMPVVDHKVRSFRGSLLQATFLYPRPEDIDHIILLMIIARRDSRKKLATRMLVVEWLHGHNSALDEENAGLRLPDELQFPLLAIPLRFRSSFCLACENAIGVVQNIMSGSPEIELLKWDQRQQTALHHGNSWPLWSAWARPHRGSWYVAKTDVIYLAREDGLLLQMEIDSSTGGLAVTNTGELDANISTAFAVAYHQFADVIIVAGDSGPGGTWKIHPREDPVRASILPNWTPIVDIISVPEQKSASSLQSRRSAKEKSMYKTPDILYAATGRGVHGNLSAFRWGLQAKIGVDVDLESSIRQVWAYLATADPRGSMYVVISLVGSTVLLEFPTDLDEIKALEQDETPLDLSSRTLCVHQQEQTVHVTEHFVTIISQGQSFQTPLYDEHHLAADYAACSATTMVVANAEEDGSHLHVARIGPLKVDIVGDWKVKGEVTCLAVHTDMHGQDHIIIGSLVQSFPWISMFDPDGHEIISQGISLDQDPLTQDGGSLDLGHYESLTSIRIISGSALSGAEGLRLLAGTRLGRVIQVHITGAHIETTRVDRIGKTPATVVSVGFSEKDSIVVCDDNLILQSSASGSHERIITTNASELTITTPPVQWVCTVPVEYGGENRSLLMVSGSRLLLTELAAAPALVPRGLSLGATPTKVLYSKMWKCFIVALQLDNGPTLAFVDEQSGQVISTARDRDGNTLDHISGLGQQGDRIYSLFEWFYEKDGKTFPFLVATTKNGSLLTISVKKSSAEPGRIEYWTRYKTKGASGEPIYSVVGDDEGLIYCAGDILHYQILDTREKKMRHVREFALGSPAVTMEVRQGNLLVLTASHSLFVIDYKAQSASSGGRMVLLHADGRARDVSHMITLEYQPFKDLNLVSDLHAKLVGLRKPEKANNPLEVCFEASLKDSVRRFVRGQCRPSWSGQKHIYGLYGTLRTASDDSDVFGVSLNGTLQHFTLLSLPLWRFLDYVMDESAATSTHGRNPSAADLHIDGDALARSLQHPRLASKMADTDRLAALLDAIDQGHYTQGFRDSPGGGQRYVTLAEEVLAYVLAAVI